MNYESPILQRVSDFIARHAMLPLPDATRSDADIDVIIGFSGGADSMALLDIFTCLGYRVLVAHCNFTLRAEESERDNRFARTVAERYGVAYREVRFQTETYAAEQGLSIEMAARELRYAWFEELRQAHHARVIAVAHHADDTVETFFLNLLRGTGIAGLTGIPAINGAVVRPLLCLTRAEIEAYLEARALSYVTDSTNLEDHYRRNKIRLNLLPLLQTIAPGATDAVRRTMHHLADAEAVYRAAVDDLRRRALYTDDKLVCGQEGPTVYLRIAPILSSAAPETMLFELLRPYGVSPTMNRSIFASLEGASGKQFFTPTSYYILKDRTALIITRLCASPTAMEGWSPESVGLRVERIAVTPDLERKTGKQVALFDARQVKLPLLVRHWRVGDRFVPFGMRKAKKLSDYFAAAHFSRLDKERALLLVDATDRILWIVGERADDRFRLTPESTEALRITLSKHE